MRVFETLGAFSRSIASKSSLPKPTWHYSKNGSGVDLTVSTNAILVSASLWQVHADTEDFRNAKSGPESLSSRTRRSFTTHIDAPDTGYGAAYADMVYTVIGLTFHLTTQLEVLHK